MEIRLPLISTIGESAALEQSHATGSPNQRKVVLAKGMFWAFFSDGKDLMYRTSSEGEDWSREIRTRIKTGSTAESVSTWHNNRTDEIFYSLQRHREGKLEIGHGTLESNGSVGWSDPPILVQTRFPGQFPGTFVCTSNNRDIWAGTTTLEKEQERHTEVWRFDGQKAAMAYDVNFGPRTAIRPPIILPTSTGILLIYGRTHHSDSLFITSTTDGIDWKKPVSPAGKFCLGGAAVLGNNLYYCGPSEGSCRFFVFNLDEGTIRRDLVLESNGVIQATMATDNASRLVAIYASTGKDCSIFYRLSTDLGETWMERRTLAEGEPIAGFSLTSSKDIAGNKMGVEWSSGLKRLFKVRFGKITI